MSYGPIYGLGAWAIGDDHHIEALIRGENDRDNPNRLASQIKTRAPLPGEPRVLPVCQTEKTGTNRVIRVYRQTTESDYEIVERIDFEQEVSQFRELPKDIKTTFGPIHAVLVKDHGHGIVTPDLIGAIVEEYKDSNPRWYISTKRWKPEWIKRLRGSDVRLIFSQHEAAAEAFVNWPFRAQMTSWTIDDRYPSRTAMIVMDEYLDWFCSGVRSKTRPIIGVGPERNLFLARVPMQRHTPGYTAPPEPAHQVVDESTTDTRPASYGHGRGYIYTGHAEKGTVAFVPKATATLASLFHADTVLNKQYPWNVVFQAGLDFAALWAKDESGRIGKRDWHRNSTRLGNEHRVSLPHNPDSMCLSYMVDDKGGPTSVGLKEIDAIRARSTAWFDWTSAKSEYDDAFAAWPEGPNRGYGLLRKEPPLEAEGGYRVTHELHLWRAMSDVPGRISIVRPKREMLRNLSQEMTHFIRSGRSHHKSFMIVDDPGGGKTTLIRALAQAKGLSFVSVNITELTRRTDLLGFFDTIVTTQAQNPETPLLVFVDEINALLEGHSVYSAFLAPLEDGHYSRDGRVFNIAPCIWVFAGTDDLKSTRQESTVGESQSKSCREEIVEALKKEYSSLGDEKSKKSRDLLMDRLQRDRAQKKSDFVSRLTLPPFVLNRPFYGDESALAMIRERAENLMNTLEQPMQLSRFQPDPNDDPAKQQVNAILEGFALKKGKLLERVYIGCEMLKRNHPHLKYVSLRVIMSFAYLPEDLSFRDLRHDLERMKNLQRSRVTWDNLPEKYHERKGQIWQLYKKKRDIPVGLADQWPTSKGTWARRKGTIRDLTSGETDEYEHDRKLVEIKAVLSDEMVQELVDGASVFGRGLKPALRAGV